MSSVASCSIALSGAADLKFVLEQRTTPTQRLRVRSRRPSFLLPRTFDPAKLFRIRLVLPQGQTTLSGDLTIFRVP